MRRASAYVCSADAQQLPFRSGTFDCAVSINVIRHVGDRAAAFREARRVVRGGPFVVKVSTAETLRGDWVLEYFPDLLSVQPPYQREDLIVDELRRSGFAEFEVRRFVYEDALDGSFQALKRFPDRILDGDAARNTAVFHGCPGLRCSPASRKWRAIARRGGWRRSSRGTRTPAGPTGTDRSSSCGRDRPLCLRVVRGV